MLSGNQLSGAIPAELGNLTHLTALVLSGNQLSGAIPAELGDLAHLTALVLSGNQLSGAIPAELGNLTHLTTLWLNDNQLSGAIPAELGDLANLEWLVLSGNQLSGAIPAELGDLANLTRLFLADNPLSGCIPAGLRGVADDNADNDPDNDLDQLGLPYCGAESPSQAQCLRGDIAVGYSLVVYAGGSFADLEACAQRHGITAMYTLVDGQWVSYRIGAPVVVNRAFMELYGDGLPAVTPLVVRSDSPVAAGP